MLKTIVIIEDEKPIIEFIKELLNSKGGYDIKGYLSGIEGIKAVKSSKPDLLLIDLQLQDVHGESVCKELRKEYPDLPIIILTGDKSHESIISSLQAGADDYITKPFNSDELVARINARLRNSGAEKDNFLVCKDLTVNLDTVEVNRKGKEIKLTAKEFELLKYMLLNKARILTRDNILNAVWGYTSLVDTRVVDVHIGKLRYKIDRGNKEKLIRTERGFGYRIAE